MYRPYQPAPSFTFKLPLRLVESVFGRDNFDDCGDWVRDWLAEHLAEASLASAAPPGYRLEMSCDFETSHPNPWFHTLNCTARLPDADMARRLQQALENVFTISSRRDSGYAGGDARRRCAARLAPCKRLQRRRPPAEPLSRRVGAKSGDFFALDLTCTPVQAAPHRFELIPIALQRGGVEIVNTF